MIILYNPERNEIYFNSKTSKFGVRQKDTKQMKENELERVLSSLEKENLFVNIKIKKEKEFVKNYKNKKDITEIDGSFFVKPMQQQASQVSFQNFKKCLKNAVF